MYVKTPSNFAFLAIEKTQAKGITADFLLLSNYTAGEGQISAILSRFQASHFQIRKNYPNQSIDFNTIHINDYFLFKFAFTLS